MEYDVSVRDVVAQPIVSIRTHTSLARMAEFMGSAYGELFQLMGRQGVPPAGPPFAVYHDPEFKEDDIDVEAGVPVAEPVASVGRVVGGELRAGPVAFTHHLGPYEEIGGAYSALTAWVQAKGREIDGPPREFYIVGVGQAEPSGYRTEVQFPIR
jgi:effector-binding domain-containing protein